MTLPSNQTSLENLTFQKGGSLFFKTAVFSWGLIIFTVSLFIAFLVPVSHTVLEENLKTLGEILTSSISQTTDSAIAAENYSSMIDHCLKIIADRPTIKFIVISRNDGFSLIVKSGSWRKENLDNSWRPRRAMGIGVFETNSLCEEEIYLYGRPLIYSEIRWGWIHIGLSLEGYNKFRKKVVYILLFAASLTILGGLVVSLFFSRRLSRPILLLEEFVKQIGSGNFTAKAKIDSNDEVESLAHSFNRMAEDLDRSRCESAAANDYSADIIRSLSDPLLVFSSDGEIKTVNEAVSSITGWTTEELIGKTYKILFPCADSKYFREAWESLEKKGILHDFPTVMMKKNELTFLVLFSGAIMKNRQGEFVGIVVIAKDNTERKQAEEKIKKSLAEKELLLKEIHHRVKNNMQVISSLLRLQASKINDKAVAEIFQISQNRIKTMALIHEMLYRSKDLGRINFGNYIKEMVESLVRTTVETHQQIELEIQFDTILIEIETAIPCGLIINEVVSNSLKHAFPNERKGKIAILVQKGDQETITLNISDNGVGYPNGIDPEKKGTLGLELINNLLTGQLHGEMSVCWENGTKYQFSFVPKVMLPPERSIE
ncbi:MAG: PAS domain S-box protein [Candidatus Riflebacteria bacterium]|nr:PAS domain S-box protein [Candidatus Riflebacteria bacterium]